MAQKITLLTFLIVFIQTVVVAQSSYRSGYIIDNSGQSTGVEIRERDWSDNPTNITYRSADSGVRQTVGVSDLRGFGLVDDDQRFVRAVVQIEQSSAKTSELSYDPTPDFITDTVWLRQFIEGEADLFYWSGGKLKRYFYRLDDGLILPLVFRQYRVGTSGIRSDERFRYALSNELGCATLSRDIRRVDYNRRDLVDYFSAYNDCQKAAQSVYVSKGGPKPRFAIRIGAEESSPEFVRFSPLGRPYGSLTTAEEILPRIGIEVEQPLEFSNRRWSVFLGLEYRRQKSTRSLDRVEYRLDRQSLELPLGVRLRAFDLGRNSLHLMGAIVADVPIANSGYYRGRQKYKLSTNFGFATGVGIRIGNHFEVGARYRFNHNLLSKYQTVQMLDSGASITVAYRR